MENAFGPLGICFFEAKLPLVGRRLGRKGGNVEEKKALGTKMRSFCSTQLFFGK